MVAGIVDTEIHQPTEINRFPESAYEFHHRYFDTRWGNSVYLVGGAYGSWVSIFEHGVRIDESAVFPTHIFFIILNAI